METTAQFLYDLRELTGFISGNDLHDLFSSVIGNPSPSGRAAIDISSVEKACPAFTEEMSSSAWMDHAKEYSGIKGYYCRLPLGKMPLAEAALRVARLCDTIDR